MWAIKIFDDASEGELHRLLDLALKRGAGIECALYHSAGFPKSIDERLKAEFSGNPKHALGLHLPHAKLSLHELSVQRWGGREMLVAKELGERWIPNPIAARGQEGDRILSDASARLAKEAGWARKVGCRDAVIHLDRGNMAESPKWRELDPKAFAAACVPAIEAAWALGLRLHLEKTYEPRAWLDAFFESLDKLGLAAKFGFTFDIGHSRVWEREPLGGWMESIARYSKMGFGLHFHLHGNQGDVDSHDTLCLAQASGWLDPVQDWAPAGVMPILFEIRRLYEYKALLVLETSSVHAEENLGWVELAFGV
jgi:hypothetical protein